MGGQVGYYHMIKTINVEQYLFYASNSLETLVLREMAHIHPPWKGHLHRVARLRADATSSTYTNLHPGNPIRVEDTSRWLS